MRILLITAPAGDRLSTHWSKLLNDAFLALQQQHAEHEWIIAPGSPLPGMFSFVQRNRQVRAIRQQHPSVVLYASPGNMLRIKDIPVVTFISNEPDKRSLKKLAAAGIITDSPSLKDHLLRALHVPSQQVQLVSLVNDALPPMDQHQKLLVHERLTTGKEYFFYGGHIGSDGIWERVLQGFSGFKKWQQSGLQLVLGGQIQPSYQVIFQEKLDAYRYKHEVICASHLSGADKEQLAAAAFACLQPGHSFDDRMQILHAFRSSVPVIGEKHRLTEELAADAMLYADWTKGSLLSQQIIALYKDENLYNQLVEKGSRIAEERTWRQSLHQLHNSLMVLSKNL
ncbi:MAG TPA: hypothetical protein VD996_05995 [Chitinophagaceae bacterium]|nr:hypothetical protein [Chitinophagaceae bacterium]